MQNGFDTYTKEKASKPLGMPRYYVVSYLLSMRQPKRSSYTKKKYLRGHASGLQSSRKTVYQEIKPTVEVKEMTV